ncbi:MAG: GAF domain-containing protein [Terriglobales bacterium]
MLPEFDDSFDRKLAEWFALRKGVWSGTAAELLAAVQGGPEAGKGSSSQSAHTLYALLESRRHVLRSRGVEVRLHQGPPRILSLRHCPVGISTKKPPATATASRIPPVSAVNAIPLDDHGQDAPASSEEAKAAPATEISGQDIFIGRPDSAARFVSGRYAEKESTGGRVFENTGAALSTVGQIRSLIADQNLGLEAAIELMANRAQEITQCCGTAVGVLEQNTVVYAVRTGIGATTAGLDLHANFFRSCVRTGGALQLRDAQRHPILGTMCQLEGVGSLIIVPIFHHRRVVGAMEFFYRESRSFSTGHVMDLELIAGAVSERLSAAAEVDLKPEEPDDDPKPQAVDITDSVTLKSLGSRLATAPTRMRRALKRVWTQGAQAAPAAQESGATTHPAPDAEMDGAGPVRPEARSISPSGPKPNVPSESQEDGPAG